MPLLLTLLLLLLLLLLLSSQSIEIDPFKFARKNTVTNLQCRKFKCCLDDAKKSFYRAANAVLGKICRIALEEVTLEIIRCKCIPILLYGTEAFMLNKSDLSSLGFVITRLFMKLFRTNNIETVEFCQDQFGFDKPSVLWARRVRNFDSRGE